MALEAEVGNLKAVMVDMNNTIAAQKSESPSRQTDPAEGCTSFFNEYPLQRNAEAAGRLEWGLRGDERSKRQLQAKDALCVDLALNPPKTSDRLAVSDQHGSGTATDEGVGDEAGGGELRGGDATRHEAPAGRDQLPGPRPCPSLFARV
eukprot:764075-Hanusia_phi.AAC.2